MVLATVCEKIASALHRTPAFLKLTVDYQVVEKGFLPFLKRENQKLRFLLLSQNQ